MLKFLKKLFKRSPPEPVDLSNFWLLICPDCNEKLVVGLNASVAFWEESFGGMGSVGSLPPRPAADDLIGAHRELGDNFFTTDLELVEFSDRYQTLRKVVASGSRRWSCRKCGKTEIVYPPHP